MLMPVYLWVELSLNRDEWLTSLKLSHTDKKSPFYKDLAQEDYISFTHKVGEAAPPR
jgi:hypothetical protein